MNCPTCKTPMTELPHGSHKVETCEGCHGVWYDSEELRLAKDAADEDLRWLDFDLWADEAQVGTRPSDRQCPGCDARLVTVEYAHTKVEIEACPACKGIWLDDGEFEQIVAALEDEVTSKTFPEYVRASLEEAREVVAGPESTVSEWRDLTTVLRLAQYRLLVEKPTLRNSLIAFQRANPFR